ncbi:phosphoinositide-3-kinase-interacting protein 1 [Gouania willdenowi]|uniref:Kringle domain-containing protein n=1 Tax=Gouania willdenowi TaxID=441366 RepID=A0A8C5HFV6_GOUWI|nr:phosphoinositide-3-kinase-interacting protein 1 [Gouania willdenowi]
MRCEDSFRHFCRMFVTLHVVVLSVVIVEGSASDEAPGDCMRSRGEDYRGNQQTSSTGLTCLSWTNSTRDYDVTVHPDSHTGAGDHNYCRNPDSSQKPWCYIAGPVGATLREFCTIKECKEQTTAAVSTASSTQSSQPAQPGADGKPVMSISQRVQTGPKKKKDLGLVGKILGILMMVVIIALGVGITLGYFYKRGRDLKKKHEEHVHEREMQRITLPLSAFSNPTCELVDENTIVITAEHDITPVQEGGEGGDPLMGPRAGTPGA